MESTFDSTFAEWAKAGGGRFFDATDADSLATAIAQALRVPFRVLDGAEVVAEGLVNGDPLELPAGEYTIEVLSEPPLKREGVVAASNTITLRLTAAVIL